MALAKNINFSYKEVYSPIQSNFAKFISDSTTIKYEGNIISGAIDEKTYKVSDLSLVGGGTMKAQISQITVLSISNLQLGIPIFSLAKELMFDKLMEKAFIDDIDFEGFPEFSKKYKLMGIDEPSIRKFFNREILSYFESNRIYNVESLGTELIVYNPTRLFSVEEIKQALEFSKNLIALIEKTHTERAALEN